MTSLSTSATPVSRLAGWVTAIVLLLGAVLLFTRLGHYALWDDEAITAMTARGVWRTGDTTARVDDHNILAYRNGLLVRNLKDRFTPPLQFYLLAPFVGLIGESPWVCRMPFALCGLGMLLLLSRWMWVWNPRPMVWIAAGAIVLTNASLFLFCRQCRYYGPAIFFSTGVLFTYARRDDFKHPAVWLSMFLALLLTTQYINFAAAVVCLFVDYAIWGRRDRRYCAHEWLAIIAPQIVVGGIVCSIWNPLSHGDAISSLHPWLDKSTLLWWNVRDAVASQFVVWPLILVCPLLFFRARQTALLRTPFALLVYVCAVVAVIESPVHGGFNAELRYLAPAIPLGMCIAVLSVWAMDGLSNLIRMAIFEVAAISLVIQPFPSSHVPVFDPAFAMFYRELLHPMQEPYTPTIRWIRAHVKTGESILVQPDWMTYPLMFACPKAVYAWQLDNAVPSPQFAKMPDIHFKFRIAPDWLIAFGPYRKEMAEVKDRLTPGGIRYALFKTLDVYWQDQYRPERVWRSFRTPAPIAGEQVYIYKRLRD